MSPNKGMILDHLEFSYETKIRVLIYALNTVPILGPESIKDVLSILASSLYAEIETTLSHWLSVSTTTKPTQPITEYFTRDF